MISFLLVFILLSIFTLVEFIFSIFEGNATLAKIFIFAHMFCLFLSFCSYEVPKPSIIPNEGIIQYADLIKIESNAWLATTYYSPVNQDPKRKGIKYENAFALEDSNVVIARNRILWKWSKPVSAKFSVNLASLPYNQKIKKIEVKYTGPTLLKGSLVRKQDLKVVVTRENQSLEEIDDYEFDPFYAKLGKNTISVSYHGYDSSIDVNALNTSVVRVEAYVANDGTCTPKTQLSQDMFKVFAVYSDGRIEETNDYYIDPPYIEEAGMYEIQIRINNAVGIVKMECVDE